MSRVCLREAAGQVRRPGPGRQSRGMGRKGCGGPGEAGGAASLPRTGRTVTNALRACPVGRGSVTGTLAEASDPRPPHPQFLRKSTQGVSYSLFALVMLGNTLYGLSVLLKNPEVGQSEGSYLLHHLPWLVGSLGVLLLDTVVSFGGGGHGSLSGPGAGGGGKRGAPRREPRPPGARPSQPLLGSALTLAPPDLHTVPGVQGHGHLLGASAPPPQLTRTQAKPGTTGTSRCRSQEGTSVGRHGAADPGLAVETAGGALRAWPSRLPHLGNLLADSSRNPDWLTLQGAGSERGAGASSPPESEAAVLGSLEGGAAAETSAPPKAVGAPRPTSLHLPAHPLERGAPAAGCPQACPVDCRQPSKRYLPARPLSVAPSPRCCGLGCSGQQRGVGIWAPASGSQVGAWRSGYGRAEQERTAQPPGGLGFSHRLLCNRPHTWG